MFAREAIPIWVLLPPLRGSVYCGAAIRGLRLYRGFRLSASPTAVFRPRLRRSILYHAIRVWPPLCGCFAAKICCPSGENSLPEELKFVARSFTIRRATDSKTMGNVFSKFRQRFLKRRATDENSRIFATFAYPKSE